LNNQKSNKLKYIPEELRELSQWVVYRLEKVNGRLTKPPYQTNGSKANTTNPETWCAFEEALDAYKKNGFDGIGFVFSKNDPYSGIDLDKCINLESNTLEPWAKDWVERFQSYTEHSPSKTGVHIIVKGKLPSETGTKKGDYEVYSHSRYFAFTGEAIAAKYSHIEERQEIVEELYRSLNGSSKTKAETPLPEGYELSDKEIEEIINKAKAAKNGEKFLRLFEGKWEELGYPSQSEADQAFCSIIAFYTNNPTATDQIFRQSKLYRKKWDRDDYRKKTIENAFELRHQQAKNDFKDSFGSDNEVKSIPIIHIADVKYMPIEFQIDKIWPINSVGFMSGQPGICKTWLSWDIAVSIASGTKLFGLYQCKKGKVLAFNAEDNPAMITRPRIEAFGRHKNLNIRELDLSLLNIPSIFLNDTGTQKQFETTVSQNKPDFIILDPLRNVHSLDEDKATEMSARLLHFLREINRKYSCSILIVCHDKKPSKGNGQDRASQVRGTSALAGWRDVAVYLDKKADEMTEVQIYNRSCQSISPFLFTLRTEKDSQGNLETAQLVVTTHGLIEDQKELIALQMIKEIICKHSPISRDKIVKEAEMNRKKCLGLINALLESDSDVVSQAGAIMINNKGGNCIDNSVPESWNLA